MVPVIGALGSDNPLIEGIDLTRQLATKLGARYRYLHAPCWWKTGVRETFSYRTDGERCFTNCRQS